MLGRGLGVVLRRAALGAGARVVFVEIASTLCVAERVDKFAAQSSVQITHGAVDLATNQMEPTSNFQLVSDIRLLLAKNREKRQVELLWVPAHIGLPGNEMANDAAKGAASNIKTKSPKPGQPKLPLQVVVALLKRGQRERWQQRWIATSAHKVEHDHLFRIKPGISRCKIFFSGSRASKQCWHD